MAKTRVSKRHQSTRSGRSALRSNSGGGLHQKTTRFNLRRSDSGEKSTEMHPSAYSVVPQSPDYRKTPYKNDTPSSRVYHSEATEKERQNGSSRAYPLPTPSPYHSSSKLPGPEEYIQFYWKTNDLLSELARLKFALRTVGSCGPGIQAINATITSFENLQWLFGFNTYSLFPQPQDPRFKSLQTKNDSYLSKFSRTFESVSEALDLTEKAFKDFQGAYYENSTMYLLMCLKKRFRSEARKTTTGKGIYASPSSEELKEKVQLLLSAFLTSAVEALRKDLSKYCEKGVPVISSTQKVKTSRYLNLTTIATFLSGVTASFLSLSAGDTTGALAVGVNTFLFSSLTFSIASAINSLLAMTWQKSIVREPNTYMPLWVSACINTGPMISLVISVAFFAVALCLFVFSSSQHVVTTAVTVSFAGFHTMCLLLLAMWLIFEKWNFRHVAGSAGQKLTGDSLSLAILDWIVLWPEKVNSAFMDARDTEPSQLERGRYGDAPMSHMSDRPAAHAVWDGLSNNFLSGTQSSVGGSRFSRPGDSQIGYGRASRHSEAAMPQSDIAARYGQAVPEDQEQYYSMPSSRSHPVPESDIPGYAPTEFPVYGEGGTSSDDPDGMRPRSRAHHTHAGYEDDIFIPPEPPEPIIIQPPPVDSQTYETALFLPRDEQGEYEDTDTSTSDSGESDRGDAPTVIVPPMSGLSTPAPMPASYSEHVMVIPTNPPTYVVPPGSYVAYGTQPTIGPSTQAGNYAIYNPDPSNRWQPVVPYAPYPISPVPEPVIVGPPSAVPTTYSPSRSAGREAQSSESAGPTQIIIHTPARDGPSDDDRNERHTQTGYNDRTSSLDSSHWDRSRTYPARRGSASNSIQAQQSVEGGPYIPHPTSQSRHRYPVRSYSVPARRSSTSSSQVRFSQPVVTQPQRRQSTAEQSNLSRAQSTTSFLSQPFTTEPEQLKQTGPGEPENRQQSAASRSRMGSSSLDMLQHRPRRTMSSIHYEDANRSRSNSGTRTATGGPESQADGTSEPTRRSDSPQHSRTDRGRRSDPPSGWNAAGRNRPHVPAAMSTIEEATRSSFLDDSDSSEHSATTAPETMPAERNMSGSGS